MSDGRHRADREYKILEERGRGEYSRSSWIPKCDTRRVEVPSSFSQVREKEEGQRFSEAPKFLVESASVWGAARRNVLPIRLPEFYRCFLYRCFVAVTTFKIVTFGDVGTPSIKLLELYSASQTWMIPSHIHRCVALESYFATSTNLLPLNRRPTLDAVILAAPRAASRPYSLRQQIPRGYRPRWQYIPSCRPYGQ